MPVTEKSMTRQHTGQLSRVFFLRRHEKDFTRREGHGEDGFMATSDQSKRSERHLQKQDIQHV